MSEWLSNQKMNMVKYKLAEMKAAKKDVKYMIACIHDLYQNYIISEDQEMELYEIVDTEEKYNDVWDYWNEMNEPNGLTELLR